MTSVKIFKILFLSMALLNTDTYAVQGSNQEKPLDLEEGICHHKYCRQERLEQNMNEIFKHKIATENFSKNLETYEQNKWKNRALISLCSLVGGVIFSAAIKISREDGTNTFISGILGFSVSLVAGLLIHRFILKPSEPQIRLTMECFISSAIETMHKYRTQIRFDALSWQTFDGSNMQNQIRTKFGNRDYPFIAAFEAISCLFEDLNRSESAALRLQSTLSVDDFDYNTLAVSSSELYELKNLNEKIFTIKLMITNSYELSTEKRLKKEKEEKLEAEKMAELERSRRRMAEYELFEKTIDGAQKERDKAKKEEEEKRIRTEKIALEKKQQQQELDHWKKQQVAKDVKSQQKEKDISSQQKELDYWNTQKAKNDALQQKEQLLKAKKEEESRIRAEKVALEKKQQEQELNHWKQQKVANDASSQQKELDYWNAQKANNEAIKKEELIKQQEAQLVKELDRQHAEHLEQKALAQAEEKKKKNQEQLELARKRQEEVLAQFNQQKINSEQKTSKKEESKPLKTFGADECAYCLAEPPVNPKQLACGHVFCSDCGANKWIEQHKTCPTCRAEIK